MLSVRQRESAMSYVPTEWIERDVQVYRQDVESWVKQHAELKCDLWPFEDLVKKANFCFECIYATDLAILRRWRADSENNAFWEEQYAKLRRILAVANAATEIVLKEVDRLASIYGTIEGHEALKANYARAVAELTDDAEYFCDDALVALRDKAIDSYNNGHTEPLVAHENR